MRSARLAPLIRNLRLDKLCKKSERFLPAEIAGIRGNDVRHPLLHDIQLRADGHLPEGDRHLNFPRQVRIIELVRVADPLVRRQFEELPAEGVAMSRGEIREGHLVCAADPGIHMVNLAGESVWRQPFSHGVGIKERPIDSLRRRTKYPVKPDRVGWHALRPFDEMNCDSINTMRYLIDSDDLFTFCQVS